MGASLGALLGPVHLSCAPPGPILGLPWAVWGPSWGCPGPSGGTSWGPRAARLASPWLRPGRLPNILS
eukprot:8780284-Pyramimonas_sp.AAC.1